MQYKNLYILIIITLTACRGNNNNRQATRLTITEVVDGNTIRSNNREIDLLGIENTPEAKRYLEQRLLNKKVTFARDKTEETIGNGIALYLNTLSGTSINGEMLKAGVTGFAMQGVTDSLSNFQSYSKDTEVAVTSNVERTPPPRIEDRTPARTNRNFKTVVREREKGVFLVGVNDSYGNQQGIGTGFFINETGAAVSNYHVFEGGESWLVKLGTGEVLDVNEIYYADPKNDFVIFQVGIGQTEIIPVPLYDGKVEKGEEIFVLGNPNGLESSLTRGVVSAIRKGHFDMENLIQIDAAISPGSSGSPVMTMDGTALGIATLKQVDCENCNFAVNIKLIREVLK